MDDEIDIEPYDENEEMSTGPFCPHWSNPEDCEVTCAICKHPCNKHDLTSARLCNEEGCKCPDFEEENDE